MANPVDETILLKALLDINSEMAQLREEVRVGFAALPSQYVSQRSVAEAQREARVAKRFAITATLGSFGALGTFIGILIS